MRALWRLGAAVVFGCLIVVGSARQTWAASRQVFPDLRVHERLHDVGLQASGGIDALRLYGTLSLLERRDGPYQIDITGVEHPHLMPLTVVDIYHDIPAYIQSEFSNYTVWGVLDDDIFHDAILAMSEAEHSFAHRTTSPRKGVEARRQRGLSLGVNLLGRGDNRQFDLRSDHTFGIGEMVRWHGEQRQFGAKMDFYAGRGGVDYHARGIIAQTLQRILQVANDLMDNKALAICLLGIVLLGVKVTQGIMSRPS